MKKKFLWLSCLFLGVLPALSQNLLNKPEHVVFDEVNYRYLVTNYGNGKIISIDTAGNQEVIIEGIPGCLGIHIIDTTIFISAGKNIHLYNLMSHAFIQTVPLNVANWIDGLMDDGAGNLYAAENSGKVHKVSLTDYSDTIIVSAGLPQYPQDLAYDPAENRLLLVTWQTSSPIVAIDLDTYAVSNLVATNSGQFDGIVRDPEGNLYVTSWKSGGRVYKWEPPYSAAPEIFSQGHAGPAGLALNQPGQELAVPNFDGNSVSFLSLIPAGMKSSDTGTPEIRLEGGVLSVNCVKPVNIFIFDTSGRICFQKSDSSGKITISLDPLLENKPSGIYLISVLTDRSSTGLKYLK